MSNPVELKPGQIVAETKHYLICPACSGQMGSIDHLTLPFEGTWYCDQCGAAVAFKLAVDGSAHVGLTGAGCYKSIVMLRHGDVLLLVKGLKSYPDPGDDAFFYNVHTCPVNYLKDTLAVVNLTDDDPDPHGIFAYVGSFPWDEQIESCQTANHLLSLVKEARDAGCLPKEFKK